MEADLQVNFVTPGIVQRWNSGISQKQGFFVSPLGEGSEWTLIPIGFGHCNWHRRPVSKGQRFTVNAEDAGLRLDQVIAARVEGVSRTLAKKVLATGGVFVDRKRVKVAGRLVREGQKVEVHVAPRSAAERKSAPIAIPIVELHAKYIVVDKPSGVFSAPTPQSDQDDLLAFLTTQLRARDEAEELHLVHRLDRPTSGLMVLARTKSAAARLSEQVAERSMSRRYIALLCGTIESPITCEEPIGEKSASTTFEVQETRNGVSRVLATLQTGRTHQVRLHAEALEAPVAGDSKYGRQLQRTLPSRPPRLALHATQLRFTCPKSNKVATFESPLSADLDAWWSALAQS